MIGLEECRKKLKATNGQLTDSEVVAVRDCLYALARVFIKDYLSNRYEEDKSHAE